MNQTDLNSILSEFREDEAELARQLVSLRQSPSPKLQQRLEAIPRQHPPQPRWLPRLAWAVAGLVVAALLFVSPGAKATLGNIEKMIGHVQLTMLDIYPKPTESIVAESSPMSLAEARAALSFEFGAPGYLPAHLNETHEVFITQLESPLVNMRWRDKAGGFVQLTAYPYHENNTLKTLIGMAGSEAILLNGQEAVLVRGAWDEISRAWNYEAQVTTILWESNSVQYRLLSYSDLLPATELIKMAESVR